MRIGLHALGIGSGARPEVIRAVATAAEAAGFATLWAGLGGRLRLHVGFYPSPSAVDTLLANGCLTGPDVNTDPSLLADLAAGLASNELCAEVNQST